MAVTYETRWYSCAEHLARKGYNIDPNWQFPHLIDKERSKVTIAEIKAAVAERFAIPPIDMVSNRRSKAIAQPRQVAMFLACELTPHSMAEIGRRFGNRDHTTVMHARRQVARRAGIDPEVESHVATLTAYLTRPRAPEIVTIDAEDQRAEPAEETAIVAAWCDQCQHLVHPGEAARCQSRWCKSRA